MKTKSIIALGILMVYLFGMIAFASALIVDSEFITIYPGEKGSVKIEVENNFDYDIGDVSIALDLEDIPFTSIGSSEKELDDLDDGDDDSVTFTLKSSTDITPGDYNIPYVVKYTKEENSTQEEKEGSFGIRVSAKTNLDFAVEASGDDVDSAIVGRQGKTTLRIINQGLGEIKFVSVSVSATGFELTSSNKVYIGTIDSDDSDTATFDGIFKSTSATLNAVVSYKDFDNNDQTETISLPMKVYSQEKALELDLIKKPNYIPYLVGGIILISWFIWRKIKKARKNRKRLEGRN